LLTSATSVADFVGMHSDATILAQGIDHPVVFAVLDGVVESWHFQGPLPCSLEDLVRNVAAVRDCWAIALLQPDTTVLEGVQHRAVVTLAELAGRRVKRVMPVTTGPGGKLQAVGVFYLNEEAVPEGESWLSIKPAVDLRLGRPNSPQMFDGWTVPEA